MNMVEFRVVCQKSCLAAVSVRKALKINNFEVVDLLESKLINEDGSIDCEVYLICCTGTNEDYLSFKEENDYEEIIHEEIKTLI